MSRSVTRAVVPAVVVALAGCPKRGDKPKPAPTVPGDASITLTLPPAPPVPAVPASLPPLPDRPRVTADALALGELLFHDPRLSADGKRACATCHVPERGYSGGVEPAADGKPNLRRAPTLLNLAWLDDLGWDGRTSSMAVYLPAHAKGQLDALEASAARVAAVPVYAAHIARVGGTPVEAVTQALEAYVVTRYEGDTPWDSMERTARATPGKTPTDPILAGYQLFTGRAQCAVCHPPPLYTDRGYHRIVPDQLGDKGRGYVDPTLTGAFKTPTLRGAMVRGTYFHAGSKATIDEVVAYYASAHADGASLDPTLAAIQLSPAEAKQLAVFLNMLTTNRPRPQPVVVP